MYHFCSMRLGFVGLRYLLGTIGDSHYFLQRMFLDMNQVYIVSPKGHKGIIGIIYLRGLAHHFLW
jgi:hypothetical protein